MTERLTRAHRRELESKTHQKIDLDHLAEIEVSELEHKAEEQESKEQQQQSHTSTKEDSDDSSDSSDDDDNQSDESDESDEEEEDLDMLLDKAEQALASRTEEAIQLEKVNKINTRLSRIDTGIEIDKQLYFKTDNNGRSKLVPEAVVLVENDETKPTNKSSIVLKETNDLKKAATKKERQLERDKTAGGSWFDMPKTEITPEIKRDLQVLQMRHILDRKRHYKKMGKNKQDPKYFQIGTVIESPTEFFSARINKKDRKQTIVDELLASDEMKSYYKRKYNEVNDKASKGGKKDWKKLKAQRKSLK